MAFTRPKLAWPMVFTAANNVIRAREGAAAYVDVTIPVNTGGTPAYFWRGDRTAADLVFVLEAALETALGAGTDFDVLLYSTGGINLANITPWDIDWSAAGTTADASWFGFSDAPGDNPYVGAPDIDSPYQVGRTWIPEQELVEDLGDIPAYSTSRQRMADGSMDTQRWAKWYTRDVLVDALPLRKVREADEVRAQEAWSSGGSDRPSDWWADGERFEFTPDFVTAPGTYATYKPREDTEPVLTPSTVDRYDLALPMILYVA